MYVLTLDEDEKLVRVHIEGVLTAIEARRFNTELAQMAVIARNRFGSFRFIADTAKAPVQPQEVIENLPTPGQLISDPGDRWAVIVSSALAKLQANRILAHPQAQAFLSASAAETWTNAYRDIDPA